MKINGDNTIGKSHGGSCNFLKYAILEIFYWLDIAFVCLFVNSQFICSESVLFNLSHLLNQFISVNFLLANWFENINHILRDHGNSLVKKCEMMNNRWCYIISISVQMSSMSWPSLNCFLTGLQQGISAALLQYFRGSSSPVKRLPPFSMGPNGWNYGTWWGPPSASSKAIVRSSASCGTGVPVFHNFSPVTSWSEGIAMRTSITGSHKSTKSPESIYTSLLNFSVCVFFFIATLPSALPWCPTWQTTRKQYFWGRFFQVKRFFIWKWSKFGYLLF